MIRVFYCPNGGSGVELTPDQIATALQDDKGLLWVDFQGEPPQACAPILLNTFGFHPLSVDDALQETHIPKVDDWGKYLYIVLHAVQFDYSDEEHEHVDTNEVDIFLGSHYVVTHHDQPIASVDRVWQSYHRDQRHMIKGSDFLAYRLADEMVADYMSPVEEIEDAIDKIEDQVFETATPRMLEHIFALKRVLLRLRRIVMPQREVLNRLARGDFEVVDTEGRAFFRDIYDHLVRLNDTNETMRDLLGGVLDTYLSVINNRMNEIMKALTIITTLFMPISFLASFFGMNFFQPVAMSLKAWTTTPSFLFALALMILSPAMMLMWAKRRGWL